MRLFGRKRRHDLLLQFAYGELHSDLLSMTREIHERYCRRHGIDYWAVVETKAPSRPVIWRKVELIIEAAEDGYAHVAWLDADCLIADQAADIFDASRFGIAVCECYDSPTIRRHLNCGVIFITPSEPVIEFLRAWNAAPTGGEWEDQSAFIDLMQTRPYRDLLTILPNRFNCLAVHMEARDPIIRAFHGDPDRLEHMRELLRSMSTASRFDTR